MPAEDQWGRFFNAQEALGLLGLTSEVHDTVDIGCGYGTFSIAAASRIRGTLHAIDIEQEMIDCVQTHAARAGLRNIRLHRRDVLAEGTGLPDASVDYVMLFNILHAEQPFRLLRETWRILRAGGRAAVMHWRSDVPTPRGPALTIRPRPEQILAWAVEGGLQPEENILLIGPFHFGLVLRRES